MNFCIRDFNSVFTFLKMLMFPELNLETEKKVRSALLAVMVGSVTIKAASKMFQVDKITLFHFVNKFRRLGRVPWPDEPLNCKQYHRAVIHKTLELQLVDYLKLKSLKISRLCEKRIREICYQFLIKRNKCCGYVPKSWQKGKRVTRDWFVRFINRNPRLLWLVGVEINTPCSPPPPHFIKVVSSIPLTTNHCDRLGSTRLSFQSYSN